MAFTYGGDPANSDREAVRFLIGDIDSTDQQFNDAEIDYLNAQEPNVYKAAAQGARALASKFARRADKEMGDLKIKWSQLQRSYLNLAEELEERSLSGIGTIFVGGIDKDDKDTENLRTDRIEPYFVREQFDNVRAESNPRKLSDG
ncbi:hypothetical protein LCGC14_1832640 [marine sediment metagenome]|uniref:Uncharacterized protein n=1 Tax=marine sediment metagenome TaxID=412755 RepID=A0A0F9IV47_9ZZZZ